MYDYYKVFMNIKTDSEQEKIRKFGIQCKIDENKSLLEYAKLHMDSRAVIVLSDRISNLEKEL